MRGRAHASRCGEGGRPLREENRVWAEQPIWGTISPIGAAASGNEGYVSCVNGVYEQV